MRKFYLFQDKYSKVTHAIRTKWVSMGSFELDRLFGGGFIVLCGRKAGGSGILSEIPMDPAHATCEGCIKELNKCEIKIPRKAKGIWPPKILRKMDRPRILGIPG